MDEGHSDFKDHRWFQNGWNRTFIIRECLKSCVVFFLGHVGRRNTSSGQKYPLILYVKPSNKGIITLLFFQFQLRERLFKVWNYIENHTREFKSDSFDFEIARLISDHNVPSQFNYHYIPSLIRVTHIILKAMFKEKRPSMTPAIYPRISYQLSTVNFRLTVLACVLCILLLLQLAEGAYMTPWLTVIAEIMFTRRLWREPVNKFASWIKCNSLLFSALVKLQRGESNWHILQLWMPKWAWTLGETNAKLYSIFQRHFRRCFKLRRMPGNH